MTTVWRVGLFALIALVVFVGSVESQCYPWQFQCHDGPCIDTYRRCDRRVDCDDRSDEEHCDKLPCVYLGRHYKHGDEFDENECSACKCDNSTTICTTVSCMFPQCSNPIRPPGKCCAYCPDDLPEVIITDAVIELDEDTKVTENQDNNKVTFDFTAPYDPSSDEIRGERLWKLSVWASKSLSGRGKMRSLDNQVLNGNQVNTNLINNSPLVFRRIKFNLNTTGTICAQTNYLCAQLFKSPKAEPEFTFTVEPEGASTTCVPLNCQGAVISNRRLILSEDTTIKDNSAFNPVTFDAYFYSAPHSTLISGEELWKLSFYGNTRPDGKGKSTGFVEQVLTPEQQNEILRPGHALSFSPVRANLDFSGVTCSDVPYLCTTLSQGSKPKPKFTLSTEPDDRVLTACEETPCESRQLLLINTAIRLVGAAAVRENEYYNTIRAHVDVTSSELSDDITGDDLWQLSVFTSDASDGSTSRHTVSPNVLSPDQDDQDLYGGRTMTFEHLEVNVDMRGRYCRETHYFCVELGKGPFAVPEYEMNALPEDVKRDCVPLACAEAPKRAVIVDTDIRIINPEITEEEGSNILRPNVDVTSSPDSDDIIGDDLWQLTAFTSSSPDGSTDKNILSTNILNDPQQDQDIYSDTRETFHDLMVNIDMRGKTCQEVRYLCVELKRHPDAEPQFELEGLEQGRLDCIPLACSQSGAKPRQCKEDETNCQSGDECVKISFLCDGDPDCTDGSDELNCGTEPPCEPNEFICYNSNCVQKNWVCDGEDDCGDGSDEYRCYPKLPGSSCESWEFLCVRSDMCLPASYQCDMQDDCLDFTDEIGCGPPVIVTPPEDMVQVPEGETITLICEAEGIPTPVISWRLNWGHIPGPPRVTTSSVNGRGVLTITDARPEDSGAYTCEAMNSKGNVFAIPDSVVIVTPADGVCLGTRFNADAVTPSECVDCFCFGVASYCVSSSYFITQESIRFTESGNREGVQLVNRYSSSNIRTEDSRYLQVYPAIGELYVNRFADIYGQGSYYWMLPNRFLGNQLTSYGGTLQYTIRYDYNGGIPANYDIPDCILQGSGLSLVYSIAQQPTLRASVRRTVEFREFNWLKEGGRGDIIVREPVSRPDLMRVLANIDTFLIRAYYITPMDFTSISDISFDIAVPQQTGQDRAVLVEDCECPSGYHGLSCETRNK